MKLLGGAGFAASFASPALLSAMDKRDDMEPFHWARLKFKVTQDVPDKWFSHPWGDEQFLDMVHKYTNLNVDRTWHVASLDNLDEMTKYPFIFMTAEGTFEFTEKHRKNFKEYLERGGFIFADDCVVDCREDFFFVDMKKNVEELFDKEMVKLPDDHEIYRSFYKLNGLPHMQGVEHGGWALFLNGRMALFLSPSDLHCGWCSLNKILKRQRGWFSRKKSYDSAKMGINILVYAMTH